MRLFTPALPKEICSRLAAMPAPPVNSEVKCATTAGARTSFSLKYSQIRAIAPHDESTRFQNAAASEICSRMIVDVVESDHSSGRQQRAPDLEIKPSIQIIVNSIDEYQAKSFLPESPCRIAGRHSYVLHIVEAPRAIIHNTQVVIAA